MTTEIWQQVRPNRRNPCWAFRVTDEATEVFQSRQTSIHFLSRDAAASVTRMVAAVRGPGQSLDWLGDLDDDCSAAWNDFSAHAEHMQDPRRGGNWYCSVTRTDGSRFFHTADQPDIRPRSGASARWLCELVISAAEAGVIDAYAT